MYANAGEGRWTSKGGEAMLKLLKYFYVGETWSDVGEFKDRV